jgi:hypothetical protein
MDSESNTPDAMDPSEMISPMTEIEREPFMVNEQEGESPKGWNNQFIGDRNLLVRPFPPSVTGYCSSPSVP